jgi:membrane-associated phospholipid phosphatase
VKKTIALIISGIFHPLLVPTLIFLVLVLKFPQFLQGNGGNAVFIIALLFLCTFMIPLLSLGIMRLTKVISSLDIPDRQERLLPFSVVSLLYMMTTYFFQTRLVVAPFVVFSLAVITFILVLITVISFYFKISAHMAAISGILGAIAAFCFKFPINALLYPLIILVIISGAVASARLYLNAHTPEEVTGGFALGFSVSFFCFQYFL